MLILFKAEGEFQLTSAHLLSNHDSEGSKSGAANSWNCKQLDETGDIVGLPFDQGGFHAQLGKDVVKVTGSLELGISKTLERIEGIAISALLDVPTR